MITVLCGGVGAAKFLLGLREAFADEEIVAVVNVGDDEIIHGLHVSPDIDTILYTLSEQVNEETGWGIKNETWNAHERLGALGEPTWFQLGDKDLATHLFRTSRIHNGATLSSVTRELSKSMEIKITLLPISDDPIRTIIGSKDKTGANTVFTFQEYFVKNRHEIPVSAISYQGTKDAKILPDVLDALHGCRNIIIAPSNPLLSIGPMLDIKKLAGLLRTMRDKTVAISPIVGGKAIKGPADKIMRELGMIPNAYGVALFYQNFVKHFIIDNADSHLASQIEDLSMNVLSTDTVMRDKLTTARLAREIHDLVTQWKLSSQ